MVTEEQSPKVKHFMYLMFSHLMF